MSKSILRLQIICSNFLFIFGSNKKKKIYKDEFNEYIFLNIVKLYPGLQDISEKSVAIKLYSDLRQINAIFMTSLQHSGIKCFALPIVPNTTSVTQETEKGYGTFKTITFPIQVNAQAIEYCLTVTQFGQIGCWFVCLQEDQS